MVSTRTLLWTAGSIIAVSAAVGGVSAWALTGPLSDPSTHDESIDSDTTGSSNAAPEVFIGDELESLLLTNDEVTDLFPLATSPQGVSPLFAHSGESEGVTGDPATCLPLIMNDPQAVVGSRHHRHEAPALSSADNPTVMHQYVLQYPDAATAERLWQYHVDATEQCTEFDYMSSSTRSDTSSEPDVVYTLLAKESREESSVIVGSRETQYQDEMIIFAMTTNTIIRITIPLELTTDTDPAVIASTVADRLDTALKQLKDGAL